MGLFLVATPLGHPDDITLRGLKLLQQSSRIILEETKEGTRFLRHHGISGRHYELLNEHTENSDILRLAEFCKQQDVALISDCGTPNFCDPGANLIAECRRQNIPVSSLPGPSSLATLLSLSSQRLGPFLFRGFLPAENEARAAAWKQLAKEKSPIVLMDTPYRLEKTLKELNEHFKDRTCLLACDLTLPTEHIKEGQPKDLLAGIPHKKAEFLILIYQKVPGTFW